MKRSGDRAGRMNVNVEGKNKIIYNTLKRCLTFSDALALSAALVLRSVGALLLVLAVPCVIWIGIQVVEER